MDLSLRDGLSWCLCNGHPVLLDLPADRYFGLPAGLEPVFLDWASGGPVVSEASRPLVALGLLVPGPCGRGRGPAAVEAATRDLVGVGCPRAGLSRLLRALFAQANAQRRLRRSRLVDMVRAIRERRPATGPVEPTDAAFRIASAFERSAILMSRTDRCLPRALAAWSSCRRAGVSACLVFGVRLEPFAAHCWVQLGEAVLVGDFEQARLHTPILVVE